MTDDKKKILDHFDHNHREFYSQYLELESLKNSQNWAYKATCPFHNGDTEASFHVDKKGSYKCFGCEAHGDIFDFYARQNGLNTSDDFPKVIEELAEDFGIQISKNGGSKNIDYIPEEIIQKLQDNLIGDAKIEFLKQVRGLSKEVIKNYKLGFDGERYTIPIYSRSGKVLDIRRYGPRSDAKLLPWKTFKDKDLADKWDIEMEWVEIEDGQDHWEPVIEGNGGSKAIYPFDQLDNKEILITEGPMDALKAISEGFNAVTNTCGVWSWDKCWDRYLRGKNVVLALDNDEAGEKATLSRVEQLTNVSNLKVIDWPEDFKEGGDVTDFLIKNEPDEFIRLAEARRPGTDAKPIELKEAKNTFHKWLEIEDDSFIDAVLGAHLTTRMPGDPVWFFLIAPPGSGKTELLRTLNEDPEVYSTSSITDKTIVSGEKKEEASLAPKLDDKTFIIKDFSPILSLKHEQRSAIFSDLRDCYDGYIEKEFGNQKEKKSFETHFSLIAGATPALDKYSSVQSSLGERFLKLRIDLKRRQTKEEIIEAAMGNVSVQAKMREELTEAVEGVLAGVDTSYQPEFAEEDRYKIKMMALFLAYCRTGVDRDRYDKTLNYLPESESGARPAIQLKKLAIGICWLRGLKQPDQITLNVLRRITVGSIPPKRAKVLFAIAESTERITTPEIVKQTGIPKATTKRVTDDLEVLEMVDKEKISAQGNPYGWRLTGDVEEFIEEADLNYELGRFDLEKDEEIPF